MTGVVVRDRALAIRLLAESLYDAFPGPKSATFKRLAGKRRAASHLEPCLDCGGTWLEGEQTGDRAGFRKGQGVYRDRFKREQPCEGCGGYRREDGTIVPGAGEVGVDRMTGSRVGTEKTYAAPPRDSWPCNFCTPLGSVKDVKRGLGVDVTRKLPDGTHPRCEPCEGTGTRSASKGLGRELKPDPVLDVALSEVERWIETRDQQGDYRRLEACLAYLARKSPHMHSVFHRVHVVKTASPGLLSETEATALRGAMVRLLRDMPEVIRVPVDVVALHRRDPDGELARQSRLRVKGREVPKRLLADRDADILRRYQAGERASEIAAAVGVHVSTVMRALDRAESAA